MLYYNIRSKERKLISYLINVGILWKKVKEKR